MGPFSCFHVICRGFVEPESIKLIAPRVSVRNMAELVELEKEYEYTIEFDDGTEFVHLYFTNIIDMEGPSFVRFDPLYELSNEVERKISDENVIIPYDKIIRIVKRKPPD